MANRVPEINTSTIVLVGSFNPAIFQPEWFSKQELLPEGEVDSAEIKVITPQISQFETERFVVQVTTDRFAGVAKASTNPAPLKDLVMGTFSVLEHTPVTAMGLNNHMHFSMPTTEDWHSVGDRLAPKDGWKGVLEGRPGLLSLTVQGELTAIAGAKFQIKVEPSTQVPKGVYFETNEHYPTSETVKLKELLELLGRRWEEAHVYSTRVVDHILNWTKNG